MTVRRIHRWDVSPRRAAAIQSALRAQVRATGSVRRPRLIAGADVSYDRGSDILHAAVVVISYPGLEVVEASGVTGRARFPYIPGYLSFREGPVVLRAWRRLTCRPDLLLCDGQGIAHPRGVGLATHLGILIDLPTIGCAKTRLVGTHDEPAREAGARVPLVHEGRRVGMVVRTRTGVKPIYVSPGHRIGLRAAARWALACCAGRRIPEPTRQAHIEVNRLRRAAAARWAS